MPQKTEILNRIYLTNKYCLYCKQKLKCVFNLNSINVQQQAETIILTSVLFLSLANLSNQIMFKSKTGKHRACRLHSIMAASFVGLSFIRNWKKSTSAIFFSIYFFSLFLTFQSVVLTSRTLLVLNIICSREFTWTLIFNLHVI